MTTNTTPAVDALEALYAALPERGGVWQVDETQDFYATIWANCKDFGFAVHEPYSDDQDIYLSSDDKLAFSRWIAAVHNAWPAIRQQLAETEQLRDQEKFTGNEFTQFIDAVWRTMYPTADEMGDWEYPAQVLRFLKENLQRGHAAIADLASLRFAYDVLSMDSATLVDENKRLSQEPRLSWFSADELAILDKLMGRMLNDRVEHEDNPAAPTALEGLKYALVRLNEAEDESATAIRMLREGDAELATLRARVAELEELIKRPLYKVTKGEFTPVRESDVDAATWREMNADAGSAT